MPTPIDPHREHPSTYVVQDRSSEEELLRLRVQDQIVTTRMGGVLSEQPDPASLRSVLDVGCGPGGWLIDVAKTYPQITNLVGVEISSLIAGYARSEVIKEQVHDRVEIMVMDALRMLEFPDRSFDLVNMRFGTGYLRTFDWLRLLSELLRVTKLGGVVRVTESEIVHQSPSASLTRLNQMLLEALYRAGNFFTPDNDGVTGQLPRLFRQCGMRQIHEQPHAMEFRVGTFEGDGFVDDMKYAFRTILPFIRKWTRIPNDYDEIYQQALIDMRQPDFMATWNILTVWGVKTAK